MMVIVEAFKVFNKGIGGKKKWQPNDCGGYYRLGLRIRSDQHTGHAVVLDVQNHLLSLVESRWRQHGSASLRGDEGLRMDEACIVKGKKLIWLYV